MRAPASKPEVDRQSGEKAKRRLPRVGAQQGCADLAAFRPNITCTRRPCRAPYCHYNAAKTGRNS
jgi:hypothetical protein